MRFRVLNRNPLYDFREACAVTQGEDMELNQELFNQPKDETAYWIRQIVANHSCLRFVHFVLVDERPKSVVMQIIRATKGHPQPEVQSSRPDWNNGKERSSDPYEDKLFCQLHTAESFIEMAKQRLCNRTEKRTRDFMREMVCELERSKDPFLKAVGYCAHPQCWWLGGCPELKCCNERSEKIADKIIEGHKILEKSL